MPVFQLMRDRYGVSLADWYHTIFKKSHIKIYQSNKFAGKPLCNKAEEVFDDLPFFNFRFMDFFSLACKTSMILLSRKQNTEVKAIFQAWRFLRKRVTLIYLLLQEVFFW